MNTLPRVFSRCFHWRGTCHFMGQPTPLVDSSYCWDVPLNIISESLPCSFQHISFLSALWGEKEQAHSSMTPLLIFEDCYHISLQSSLGQANHTSAINFTIGFLSFITLISILGGNLVCHCCFWNMVVKSGYNIPSLWQLKESTGIISIVVQVHHKYSNFPNHSHLWELPQHQVCWATTQGCSGFQFIIPCWNIYSWLDCTLHAKELGTIVLKVLSILSLH